MDWIRLDNSKLKNIKKDRKTRLKINTDLDDCRIEERTIYKKEAQNSEEQNNITDKYKTTIMTLS